MHETAYNEVRSNKDTASICCCRCAEHDHVTEPHACNHNKPAGELCYSPIAHDNLLRGQQGCACAAGE
jgi:hypothetical protein